MSALGKARYHWAVVKSAYRINKLRGVWSYAMVCWRTRGMRLL